MVGAFEVANAVGLVAFAVVGALKGAEADLDPFGVVVLGVITAFGGGTFRDVLVGRPASLLTTADVAFALLGVALAVFVFRATDGAREHPALRLADTVGLAAFAATGALVGWAAGVSPFGVVVLATLTGVGGGSLADLLLTRVPVVLREDFYATPAALGGTAFWGAQAAGVPAPLPTAACVSVVAGLRLLALRYDWHLPTLRREKSNS
jgi:uncharacterized membrane protein YeiH